MKKIDLLKLRKAAGLSQRELADRLMVQPSFLSAIENGRSRFPDEKIDKLKEIVALDDLEDFLIEENADVHLVPPHSHAMDETDSLTQMLRHIHNMAHKSDGMERERENELLNRIDYLSKRNDRLNERLDALRESLDSLREENFKLKELLLRNNINF
ncbi:MAG: helix-turn-helix transcriptional regulator [Muribaculaceae bacterium]|nr:helix-turn-helix transcriptional regulator [Muribaculaceae bacterium]